MPSNKPYFTPFEKILTANGNRSGTSLLLLLVWISACDGQIKEREKALLVDIANKTNHGHELASLIEMAIWRDVESLQLACEILKRLPAKDDREHILELGIGMAIADGSLSPSENHILRFLADAMGIGRDGLVRSFLQITGRKPPVPTDLSDAAFWRLRNQKSTRPKQDAPKVFTKDEIKAFGVLGLDEGSSAEEIKAAFRRLTQVHHPDRYAHLGSEAVEAASASFRRIKQAYDTLIAHA